MDPIADALTAFRSTEQVSRLRERVRADGRTQLATVSKYVLRDEAARKAAVSALVESGEVRIEVVPTKGRARVDLVWVG